MAAALLSKRMISSFSGKLHTKTGLVSRKIIKPLCPTPESLSCHKVSSIDQTMPSIYMPYAYFYPAVSHRYGLGRSQISKKIENSLSKALTFYYPFAGRIGGNDHIICNDAGVELQEVEINSSMAEIMKHSQEDVFPEGSQWRNSRLLGDSLVVIRLNYFDCGGVALAVCVSHRLGDAAGMGMFVNDLAVVSRQPDHIPSPMFIANKVFPAVDNPISFTDVPANGVSTRYIFDAANIDKLKAIAANSGVEKPTRVEVVTAFLYQHAALAASRSDSSGSLHPSLLVQPMNLRPFIGSPIQPNSNSMGNLWALNMVVSEDDSASFPKLVTELRSGKLKVQNLYKKKLYSSSPVQDVLTELFKLVIEDKFDAYYCTSACRIPIYDADFGWGKPIRMSIGQYPAKNTFFLTDTPEDGIEALISLDEPTMSKFEQDQELLSFASPYPTK